MFQEMRYVYEVYRHLSFSKAAQAMYLSQPSLSLMIKKAEERIGRPLFDRSSVPITLTDAGRAYIESAMQMMSIENDFRQYLNDSEACLTGTLALGGTTLFTSHVLPPLIAAFSERYPGVEVRIHEVHTDQLKKELWEGTLDLVADNGRFDSSQFTAHPYQEERLLLAVPASHPLNESLGDFRQTAWEIADGQRKPAVALEAFASEPFLLLKEGNDTRTRAEQLCAKAGFHAEIRLQLDQQLTAYHLAGHGLGLTFISDTLVRHEPMPDKLFFYQLDEEWATREISLFSRRGRLMTAPMKTFLEVAFQPHGNPSAS